jgi:DNA repair protein RadA/Sms
MSKLSQTKSRSTYACSDCGWHAPKWVGRCGECHAWGTMAQPPPGRSLSKAGAVTGAARPMAQIDMAPAYAQSCGVTELDRVLGGGVVPGAVVLLAGEPGIGKSTLLLQVAAATARRDTTVLYVSGEESPPQVRLRAERTGAVCDRLLLAAETDLSAVLAHIEQQQPQLLVVDSVQTISSAEVEGVPGGVTQVREVSAALVGVAKQRGMATMLVGHVTKDGTIAGPRVLEHLVDVVLHFEGDRNSRLRMVRAVKNRFGPIDEVGCFDLGDDGIVEVADPTGLFVSRHAEPVAGTCVTVSMEGRRPLLAEVQALVAPTAATSPRRATSGLDGSRVAMVLAVLERRTGLRLRSSDVYAATVGGARLAEPAADLATAMAVASAVSDRVVPPGLVALGEVGLAGELRRVSGLQRRLAEAARLGFTFAVVPTDLGSPPASTVSIEGLTMLDVPDLRSALRVLGLVDTAQNRPSAGPQPPPSPPQLRLIDSG